MFPSVRYLHAATFAQPYDDGFGLPVEAEIATRNEGRHGLQVLKAVFGRGFETRLVMGTALAVLLGIIAETRYAPIQTATGAIPGFAGLGLAFDVETVRETVEMFIT